MKKTKILNLDAFGISFILILLGIIFIFIFVICLGRPVDLSGSSAVDFCTEKCEDKDYFSSANNSEYNVIQCECVEKISYGDGKYQPTVKVESSYLYFDSITLQEISKEEFNFRIDR